MKRIACAVVAVLPLLGLAAEFYADPKSGSDENDGLSPAAAFRTLGKATKSLKAGDVLNLAAGSFFSESLVMAASGTATRPIVVRGNGSVLSGLQPIDFGKWESKGDDLWFQANDRCWGALRPRVFIGDEMISPVCDNPNKIDPKELKPRTAIWRKEGVYFRAESGRTPRDYALGGGVGRTKGGHSGVLIDGQSYIVVEDLVAQHFPNDGFNIHGSCHGLVFRNIVARHNGDDGFSIHDDVCAEVVGLHSHYNDFGIQDVGVSQLIVSGAVLENNRMCGFDEYGGIRILRDAVVRGNGQQQMALHLSRFKGVAVAPPMGNMTAYLENVRVEGGNGAAVSVDDGITVSAKNCVFSGTDVGLALKGGRVHLDGCSVSGCDVPLKVGAACNLSQNNCSGVE